MADVGAISSGDTAWVLISAGLVLFMTPGLALFYGGMVRSKHVLSMLAQNFATIAVVSIVWAVAAYSLAFGPDAGGHGFIGTLRLAGLAHPNDPVPGLALTVPPLAFVAFQMMFAIITGALLTGAGADRMRFGGFLALIALWTVVVYAPIAHWVFSPAGWLAKKGTLDFAGGTVVELCSGGSALALVLVLKPRRGWPREAMPPHSLPLTVLGAGILWFGWFGFNAGSALTSGGLASQALVNTQLAACTGLLVWIGVEKKATGHATTLGAASGAVVGLVAITPAAGYVNSMAALLIGALGGLAGVFAVRLKFRLRYDDSLDVVGVHGVGGLVGMLSLGFLASATVNPLIAHKGLIDGGGFGLLGRQLLAVVTTGGWAFLGTYAVATLVSRTVGLRVDERAEQIGLDSIVHAETAYESSTSVGTLTHG